MTHGPHVVDHTLTSRRLEDLFAISDFASLASMGTIVTGRSFQSRSVVATSGRSSDHLVEQPNTPVVGTGTGLPAKRASIASRASDFPLKFGFRRPLSSLPVY